ncbi:MAG: RagB/SusD family nutrient uptake outer membrane protein, partial [Tannerella sp.]|nr:RagB/SusD family nutrient uptake outer membrane protein [Tannerella sp.]
MKVSKFLSIIMSAIISLTTTSCLDKDFLNVLPSESMSSLLSIGNVADARIALNGMYRRMTSSSYYGRQMVLYAEFKGGDFGLTTTAIAGDALYFFTSNPSSNNYFDLWTQGFDILLQSNNIITSIDAGKVETPTAADEKELNAIKGQALVVRALVHFDLTRIYGYPYAKDEGASLGTSIVTKVLSAKAQIARNTVAECYQQVISDLNDALPLLDGFAKKNGMISYYAAKALLARVYLFKKDWDNAYTHAKDVIEKGGYTAYTADNWVSSWSKQFGSESIFELYMVPNESDLGSTSLRSYYAPRNTTRRDLGPMMVSDGFLDMFNAPAHATDVRWGIFGLDEFGNGLATPDRQIPDRKGWLMKYENDGKSNPSAVNIKIIRLSEILLLGAEAAVRKSSPDKANAVKWLNTVRQRNPSLADFESTADNQAVIDEVMLQRRIELIGEGHRYFDILRTGGTVSFTDGGFWSAIPAGGRGATVDWNFNRCVLPIGISEINANAVIAEQQNP